MCGGFALFFWFFRMRRRHRPPFVGHCRATPTSSALSRAAGAHVGVALPAKPLSSVEPRQQAPPFADLPAPMLASPCRQSLNPPSGHANKARPLPRCRRPCWRRPAGKAFVFRRATPTRSSFSHPAGAHVGVAIPAKPMNSVSERELRSGRSRKRK